MFFYLLGAGAVCVLAEPCWPAQLSQAPSADNSSHALYFGVARGELLH